MQSLEEALAALTPERLRELILQMANEQPPDERAGVDVSSIISRLMGAYGIGPGPERSRAYIRLVEALKANVAQIEGMTYVKSKD
jgi:hypothetical protein